VWSDGVRWSNAEDTEYEAPGSVVAGFFHMKLVIDVPYYFLLVVLPVVFAGALWMVLTGHSGSVQFEMPVRFQLDPASHPFVISRHDIQDVSITQFPRSAEDQSIERNLCFATHADVSRE
jgi:hypothetical protein